MTVSELSSLTLSPRLLADFRPPSVPLITHTPFFSCWSGADELTEEDTRHWSGAHQALGGLIRIDGEVFRFCGKDRSPAMTQHSLVVHPTRTEYRFETAGIELTLTFTSPLLMDDLERLARPATYVDFAVRSTDGKNHAVEVYFDASAEFCVDDSRQKVVGYRHRVAGLQTLALKSATQPKLGKAGDAVRIDWGTLYLVVEDGAGTETSCGPRTRERSQFIASGNLPDTDDTDFPRQAGDRSAVVATVFSLGDVTPEGASCYAILAYDEDCAIEYFQRQLPAYWRRHGKTAAQMLKEAQSEKAEVQMACQVFDERMESSLAERGGQAFVRLGALSYRQALAAHTIVEDLDGTLLMFSKENYSNGCIGTVDVTYPGSPLFLLLNPTLLRAQIEPILHYAATPRWRFPFAPHDLGTYPHANGQVYGGGERDEHDQMPVEECGNMLILVAALDRVSDMTDMEDRYWDVLTQWCNYLLEAGLDPERQLCTDDFAGHLAHNANLSVKALVAIAAFETLTRQRAIRLNSKPLMERADYLRDEAEKMVVQWMEMAADGDHTRLAFDRPGSWSQKYNLVWDQLLDLKLFPKSLFESEIKFYLKQMETYGLPLDSRCSWTKLDWCFWTATMTDDQETFDRFVEPLHDFAMDTANRVPLTDFYDTITAAKQEFQARSVVGGIFLPLLESPLKAPTKG